MIDDLLRSTVSEFLQYSEDSLSEEDGENSEEVSEAGNSVNNEDSEEDEYSEIEDDSEVEDSSEVNDSEQNDVSEEDEDAHTQENEVLMEVEAVAINGEKADDKGNILRRTKPAIKLEVFRFKNFSIIRRCFNSQRLPSKKKRSNHRKMVTVPEMAKRMHKLDWFQMTIKHRLQCQKYH